MDIALIGQDGKIFVIESESDDFLTYTAQRLANESGEVAAQVFMSQSFMNRVAEILSRVNGSTFFVNKTRVLFDKQLRCALCVEGENDGKECVLMFNMMIPAAILLEIVTKDDYIKKNLKNL